MPNPKPRVPAGLDKAGRALWGRLTGLFAFEAHEQYVLELACRQADLCAALEELIAAEGLSVPGSNGQPRLNAAAAELRQCRLALTKILGSLGSLAVAGEGSKPLSAAGLRAKKAADTRWNRQRDLVARQEAARGAAGW